MNHDELTKAVLALNETIQRSTSLKQRFLSGLLKGLGVALGTTIIAGSIAYGLASFLQTLDLEGLIADSMSDAITNQFGN